MEKSYVCLITKNNFVILMNKNGYEVCLLGLIVSLLLTGFSVYADASSEIITEKPYPKFVDKNKNPQYYIDRYYNEIEYRVWFDRNYPNYTIEETVGYFDAETNQNVIKNELNPN